MILLVFFCYRQLNPATQLNQKITETITQNSLSTSAANSQEYNILLIGETGCGKSVTINSFVNYLKFSNFEEAVSSSGLIHLIPSQFTLPDLNENNG